MAKLDPRQVEWEASWYGLHSRMLRTKPVESMQEGAADLHGTKLARVLTTVDLVSLGVGSCVGTGMYVVAGLVAKEMAGPGVILSFVIAAVASILSGKTIPHRFSSRIATNIVCLCFERMKEMLHMPTFFCVTKGVSPTNCPHFFDLP